MLFYVDFSANAHQDILMVLDNMLIVIRYYIIHSIYTIVRLWRQLHVKIITNAYSVNIKINK